MMYPSIYRRHFTEAYPNERSCYVLYCLFDMHVPKDVMEHHVMLGTLFTFVHVRVTCCYRHVYSVIKINNLMAYMMIFIVDTQDVCTGFEWSVILVQVLHLLRVDLLFTIFSVFESQDNKVIMGCRLFQCIVSL